MFTLRFYIESDTAPIETKLTTTLTILSWLSIPYVIIIVHVPSCFLYAYVAGASEGNFHVSFIIVKILFRRIFVVLVYAANLVVIDA